MEIVTWIDLEVSTQTNRILDYGAVKSTEETYHGSSPTAFETFLRGTSFLCGHNILQFDCNYIKSIIKTLFSKQTKVEESIIDTLYLSPLLFPKRPYHALLKDDKLQVEEFNNPLNDAKKAMELFYEEEQAFWSLPNELRKIYYALLQKQKEFCGFFQYVKYCPLNIEVEREIKELFQDKICSHANLSGMIEKTPIELAYCLALIFVSDESSITPPWVLKQYPEVERLFHLLRGTPCLTGCTYCNQQLNAVSGLKQFFGYDAYREFDGVPLQEKAVHAALHNKSLLAVFPTGGGKSITFQVPALMAGKNTKGLTVILSPLQSLMKDQVDNLEKKGITTAVTINGLLDPIERAEAIRRVREGEANLLYISPESLRSRTIENILLGRKIERFVIDEAHCFSAWGQDFRVDYLYIAEFMKKLYEKKNLNEMIPVSCFTATAKQNVIDDIKAYFKENLDLKLELFTASAARKNLHYKIINKKTKEKYDAIRELLAYKICPTIIYVARTKSAMELADKLCQDGYVARAFHGKMDKHEKSQNQDQFIRGEIDIIVATSAFGMGVDKSNVGMVIHYDISDSLENYVQEAGRAGRDQSIEAECFVLFDEEDLNKHFMMLNQSKISISEIQQIWRAIKEVTKTRARMSNSALEIARDAGWDESVHDIETRVKTAIAALEDAGYVKRGQNMPHVFADSILAKSVMEAAERIRAASRFSEQEKEQAVRIIKMLISSRSKSKNSEEIAESRVDYMAENLAMERDVVIELIQKLREEKILGDARDLCIYLDEGETVNRPLGMLARYEELELALLSLLSEEDREFNLKELNEAMAANGVKKVTVEMIQKILNFWDIKGYIKRELNPHNKSYVRIALKMKKEILRDRITNRQDVAKISLSYLFDSATKESNVVQFSELELIQNYNFERQLFQRKTNSSEVEEALLFLSRIGAIKIEGGFLVTYNAISIERLERGNRIQYKAEDYRRLKLYYEQKTQMIHVVGEYAKKLMEDYQSALLFVQDYFELEYSSFLKKYFKGSRGEEIKRNLTPEKFKQLFGELSPTQLKIINDKQSNYLVVCAGPGSGKTRILVHKLASLLMMEDIKSEQLLMLTFSRASATEFKKRLIELMGPAAYYVEIKTFHSYCFDLLGRVGTIEQSNNIVEEATKLIKEGIVEPSKVAKTVLVIDEAQDMDEKEYGLVEALIQRNETMRVIAVGDDDQNIYGFRGSDSKYMQKLLQFEQATNYELVENYRSKSNLVQFSNLFAAQISHRLKKTDIMPVQKEMGLIDIIQYKTTELVQPVVNQLINEGIKPSTCILTKTNEEALQMATLLKNNGIRVKLIQSNEQYPLIDLREIRYFIKELRIDRTIPIIAEEDWERAKKSLVRMFRISHELPLCMKMIKDFESINKKCKYVSDFLQFLRESKEDDFYEDGTGTTYVSTIHKAKGKEFDHIVLLLSNYYLRTDEDKRLLYVGLTRAKKTIAIHYNGTYFSGETNPTYWHVKGVTWKRNTDVYPSADLIKMQTGFHSVKLSYFYHTQDIVKKLVSGATIQIDEDGCLTDAGTRLLLFSERFKEEINKKKQLGYEPRIGTIQHIIYWNEREKKEILVAFPEIEFRKRT